MASPMFEIPEHFPISVDSWGWGPCDDLDFDHFECWCGDPECELY